MQPAAGNVFEVFSCSRSGAVAGASAVVSTSVSETTVTAQRRSSQRLRKPDGVVGSTEADGIGRAAPLGLSVRTPRKAPRRATSVPSPVPQTSADTDEQPARAGPSKKARKSSLDSREGTGDPSLYEGVGITEKLVSPAQPVVPLRLIIIGHNPSAETWRRGHAYSHPSNHMWRLLIKTGIAPPGIRGAEDDDKLPALAGVGFTDVGSGHPGTSSNAFTSATFEVWIAEFQARMAAHLAAAAHSIGCVCGRCGAPRLVAFSGKRQFLELVNAGRKGSAKIKSVDFGLQSPDVLPTNWPFPKDRTEVYVCTSTSGASPMTNTEREAPYAAVAARLAQIPWPLPTSDLPCRRVKAEPQGTTS